MNGTARPASNPAKLSVIHQMARPNNTVTATSNPVAMRFGKESGIAIAATRTGTSPKPFGASRMTARPAAIATRVATGAKRRIVALRQART